MPKLKHLTEYHKRAMELKYKGNSYQDIAERLNNYSEKSRIAKRFTIQTIKDWFKKSGTLCGTYKLYEKEMDEIHKETMDAIKKAGVRIREQNFRIANEMLVALMGSQTDNVKLAAVKELLDRVEGKPKESLSFEQNQEVNFMKYEERLRLAREIHDDNDENDAVGKSA